MEPSLVAAVEVPQLTGDEERLVAESRSLRDRAVWVSRAPNCDWGIDYGPGLDTLLPHLGPHRDLARLVARDAEIAGRDGDSQRCAENCAALLRMGADTKGRSPMEVLVAYAITALAFDPITAYSETWNASQREMVLAELALIDTTNPYDVQSAIAFDKRLSAEVGQPGPDEQQLLRYRDNLIEKVQAAKAVLR